MDTDSDSLPTWFERQFSFLDPNDPSDAAKDQDNDGLSNLDEYQRKTLLDNPDTDGDGVAGGVEVNRAAGATRPLVADTDQDGLPDGVETGSGTFTGPENTGTDPLKADTDGDGFPDGQEVVRGSNPLSQASTPSLTAPVAIIDLDATKLPLGPLTNWTNNGALKGQFKASRIVAEVTAVKGVKGVTLDGVNHYYTGPDTPSWMTRNAPRAIEAWIYSPEAADEETIFAWGRRGGPDGSNLAFNHGLNAAFGAVGHWGAPDLGWDNHVVVGEWTYVAYTYEPDTQTASVYSNGELANSEVLEFGLDTWEVDKLPDPEAKPLPFRLGAQNDANGTANEALRGSMSIARLRVHDLSLTPAGIASQYAAEAPQFASAPELRIESIVSTPAQDSFTFN